jgi:dolichol kinase
VTIDNIVTQRRASSRSAIQQTFSGGLISADLQTELVRKSIHMLIAVVPLVANAVGAGVALSFLAAGTVFYAYAESLRKRGGSVFVVSRLTVLAARDRDAETFVLGPVTLGLGAMLALILYPAPAASIAIYALAFGDGLASLAGKAIGTLEIRGTGGKTVEGSLVGFTAVFVVAFLIIGEPWMAFVVAAAAAIIELIPAGDADNIILPTFVGLIAAQLPL